MRRILWRSSYLSTLAVAICAAAASGAIYQWSGTGGDDDYTNPNNWCTVEPCPTTYPDDGGDDALFGVTPGGTGNVWGDVDLDFDGALTIDDMTIKDSLDFKGHSTNSPSLTVATLTIDATDAAITVTFNDDMDFVAN